MLHQHCVHLGSLAAWAISCQCQLCCLLGVCRLPQWQVGFLQVNLFPPAVQRLAVWSSSVSGRHVTLYVFLVVDWHPIHGVLMLVPCAACDWFQPCPTGGLWTNNQQHLDLGSYQVLPRPGTPAIVSTSAFTAWWSWYFDLIVVVL